jgi:hypothetical protein
MLVLGAKLDFGLPADFELFVADNVPVSPQICVPSSTEVDLEIEEFNLPSKKSRGKKIIKINWDGWIPGVDHSRTQPAWNRFLRALRLIVISPRQKTWDI